MPPSFRESFAEDVKIWLMVLLTLVFVTLYVFALFGWIQAPAEEKHLARLESIVGVIIGYFFGRVPSITNEKQLNQRAKAAEVKADAAASLEAKLESVKAVLAGDTDPDEWISTGGQNRAPRARSMSALAHEDDAALLQRIAAAVRIVG